MAGQKGCKTKAAFLRDFAGDVPEAKARVTKEISELILEAAGGRSA